DFMVRRDAREITRQRAAITLDPTPLQDTEVTAIVDFLGALTGETAKEGKLGIPPNVPSGLPMDARPKR
ncbi:MAG: methylamine utilization protein MauG, partial [Tateyamaria sp.]